VLVGHAVYPNQQAMKCNNMQNHNSSECEDITEGAEG
jgi:hypothetical protein